PMHLGIGTASWTDATDGTSSAHSVTALLRPLTMQLAEDDDILLTLRPGLSLNSELAQALRDKGLKLDISQFDKVGDFSPLNALRFLREAGSLNLVGFDMYESLTLGVFVKPADIVIGDLQRLRERAVESTVVAALAGDATARAALAKPLAEPIRTDRDPHTEKGVGLLDPLQHDALDAVAAGRSLVLDT
ncbi:prevent-host-death family protein, partial [Gleimia europaea]|nr:prevent-host-death family protein [Gleimia europaea]